MTPPLLTPPTVGVNNSVMFNYVLQHHTVPPRANTLGLRLPGLVTVLPGICLQIYSSDPDLFLNKLFFVLFIFFIL